MLPAVAGCCGDEAFALSLLGPSLLHFKHLHSVLATAATRQLLAPHLLWNSLEVQGQG